MLRAEVGGAREVEAHGATVGEVIEDLVERYPALRPQLYRDGDLGELVNVYLGGVSSAPSTRPPPGGGAPRGRRRLRLADGGWKYLSADFWGAEDVGRAIERSVWR